jgi:hypothetical protein
MRRGRRTTGAPAHALVAAAAAWALAGCLGDVTVRRPLAKNVATASRRGEGRAIVLLAPFASLRKQARCGMRKNGYNMDIASVLCDGQPEAFLADLLARQLATAGFVVYTDARAAGPSTLVLSGVLEELFLEPKHNGFTATYETDLALVLTAKTGGGLLATRRFYVKGQEAAWLSADDDMQRSLDSGVRQLVAAVVGAVANLADRVPAVAAPPGAGS